MMKLLLVEDEPMWQQGIQALLQMEPHLELVGIVDNADDAEVYAQTYQPDVILLDWKIKGPRDGLVLAKALEKDFAPCQMILVTGSPPEQIPSHPYYYVPKSRISTDLVPKILEIEAQQKLHNEL